MDYEFHSAAPIWEYGTRPNLLLGADRELVLGTAMACTTLFLGMSWTHAALAVGLWSSTLLVGRIAAKNDPLYLRVLWRTMRYRAYYPASRTPYTRRLPVRRWQR